MPKPSKGPRLGGSPAHEKLILSNLATSLFKHGKIKTTETKAKRLRPVAERLVTAAKRGDLAARRRVATVVRDRDVESRTLSQAAWTPIVFFGFAPGAIGWLAFGRPLTTAPPGGHDSFGRGDAVAETSEEFRERVRARAEEQRRRYAEQKHRRRD